MHYTPRTIAFLAELFHPPLTPDPNPIQRIHNQLFEGGEPAYRSFAVTAHGAELSNPGQRPGEASSAIFLPDRIQFREELGGLTIEEFALRVQDLAQRATTELGIQVFTGHQVTIRTLVNPRNFFDSREFMKAAVFGLDDETSVFERDPQLFGLRMVFPPDAERPNQHALRIESFAGDPRSIFIENQAGFAPILCARGLDPVAENVHATYAFLVEKAMPFLEGFDIRIEEE